MSRITCLIMISGCSALSINSFKFARIKVETLSSNAITPPKYFDCFQGPTYKFKFPACMLLVLLRGKRLRRAPADPINTPATSPMPSQKSQLPANRPATIPSTAPRTKPMIEIFFIAFLHHCCIYLYAAGKLAVYQLAGRDAPRLSRVIPCLQPWLCLREAHLHQAVQAKALGLCRQSASPWRTAPPCSCRKVLQTMPALAPRSP